MNLLSEGGRSNQGAHENEAAALARENKAELGTGVRNSSKSEKKSEFAGCEVLPFCLELIKITARFSHYAITQ